MAIDNIVKSVPSWAWYTSAGVGIAGTAIYVFRNRAGAAPEDASSDVDPAVQIPDPWGGSPVPGVVASPVQVIQPSGDDVGLTNLVGGYDNLLGWATSIFTPVAQQNADITDSLFNQNAQLLGQVGDWAAVAQGTVSQIALSAFGGGSTSGQAPPGAVAVTSPDAPVSAVAPPKPAVPAPAKTGSPACGGEFPYAGANGSCYKLVIKNDTRGSSKGYWCVKEHWHYHKDGRKLKMSEDMIKTGKC